jgi:hypothetical protein
MLKPIQKSDVLTREIPVYKEWELTHDDLPVIYGTTGSGLFDPDTDETNIDGSYKRLVYKSIKSQFYTNPATSSILTEVGKRRSYASTNERVIHNDIAVISVPQSKYGNGIKVGSVVLRDDSINRTYTDDSFSNLIDSGSNIKGNIFYDRGLIVMTDDVVSGSNLMDFELRYRSTKKIYENEVFISVTEGEFNFSQNPSAIVEEDGRTITTIINRPGVRLSLNDFVTSSYYKSGVKRVRNSNYAYTSSLDSGSAGSFDDYEYSSSIDPTGSYLAPYITTIGLYDDDNNMVVVAKLPQPIKSLPDYPVNFIVRFDT